MNYKTITFPQTFFFWIPFRLVLVSLFCIMTTRFSPSCTKIPSKISCRDGKALGVSSGIKTACVCVTGSIQGNSYHVEGPWLKNCLSKP